MRLAAGSQLTRRSKTELDALFLAFNMAVARTKPFSKEWKDATLSVDNIISERKRRAALPAPKPF